MNRFNELLALVRLGASELRNLGEHSTELRLARNTHGDSLLHIAAAEGDAEGVAMLLALGCDANARNTFGTTPIECAAFRGHRQVMSLLMTAGADLSATDNTGFTVIDNLALLGKDDEIVWLQSRKRFAPSQTPDSSE